MIYLTNDGQKFMAESAEHLVALLRADSWSPTESDRAFMRDVAERAYVQTGERVRYAGEFDEFVTDLERAGLIKRRGK